MSDSRTESLCAICTGLVVGGVPTCSRRHRQTGELHRCGMGESALQPVSARASRAILRGCRTLRLAGTWRTQPEGLGQKNSPTAVMLPGCEYHLPVVCSIRLTAANGGNQTRMRQQAIAPCCPAPAPPPLRPRKDLRLENQCHLEKAWG